ncbi:hypothetical protein DAPPUDRAFT_250334 [Daphnia pulex]|uniref:Nuclear receptor domain-containing protein n=1 Tax=Daphnia pulex TaxID=6669 RepID=E9GYC5_DAPPU|nr:hypothetical protein DAPPUDRAFT_250334 [Daphnia pulex]|eukprot:EFX75576.1 hypothetical protein DAPPUDRAFT_250334 [Daphnia pulex]
MEISQQKLGSEHFEKEKDETEEGKETQQQERCLVCFDIALNYVTYGARTCGNCAAFFKTTIDESRNFVCFYSNNCNSSHEYRCEFPNTSCKSCRFQQYLKIGMKKKV